MSTKKRYRVVVEFISRDGSIGRLEICKPYRTWADVQLKFDLDWCASHRYAVTRAVIEEVEP